MSEEKKVGGYKDLIVWQKAVALVKRVYQVTSAFPSDERFGLVSAPRTEFVARSGEEFWPERLTVRESRFRRPPKIIHRTHPLVRIRQPHPVDIWIEPRRP